MTALSEEARLILNDSIGKYLAAEYDFDRRRAIVASEDGYSREHWQAFADLGWLGIPFEAELCGLGGSALDCLDLCRAFGRHLVVEPYLSACGAAGSILQQCTNTGARETLVPRIVSGELIPCLAHEEIDARGNGAYVTTTAEKTEAGYHLRGSKAMAMHAPLAGTFIISARLAGNTTDEEGIGLFLVDASDPGLTLAGYTSVDGHRAGNLTLDCRVNPDALLDERDETLRRALQTAALMQLAEGLGAMETLLDTTLEYPRVRKQFGTAIASFQAIRHRLADMYIAYHQANNLLSQTLEDHGAGDLPDHSVAILKAQFQKSAKYVGEQSVQLHGGIGMTDELTVGHYLKRLTAISTLMGPARFHLRQIWAGAELAMRS